MRINAWAIFIIIFVILLFIGLIVGINHDRVVVPEEVKPYEYLIGVSQPNLTESWRVQLDKDIKEAAKNYDDLRVIYTACADDAKRQIEDIKRLVGYGIDLLIVSAVDKTIDDYLKIVNKKIPVIAVGRHIHINNYTTSISVDPKIIAKLEGVAANLLTQRQSSEVLIILGDNKHQESDWQVLLKELNKYNQDSNVMTIVGNWRQDISEDTLKGMLRTEETPIDIIIAENDDMAYGAYLAMNQLRLPKPIIIGVGGLEGENKGIDLVDKEIIDATILCPTGGKESIDYAIQVLEGEIKVNQIVLEPEIYIR